MQITILILLLYYHIKLSVDHLNSRHTSSDVQDGLVGSKKYSVGWSVRKLR